MKLGGSLLPSNQEWVELSGGRLARSDPLLTYIDKRVADYAGLRREVARVGTLEARWQMLGCLTELMYATRMYTGAYRGARKPMARGTRGLSDNTFGLGRVRRDGNRSVNAPLQKSGDLAWNRYEAVEALEGLAEQELCALLKVRNRTELHRKIRAAQVCQIDPAKSKADRLGTAQVEGVRTQPARYLNILERAEYRVMFDGGVAKTRCARDDVNDPYEWMPAETLDNKNECAKDLKDALKTTYTDLTGQGKDVFSRGAEAFQKWYRGHGGSFLGASGYVLSASHKLFMASAHEASGVKAAGFYHSSYTSGQGVVCSGSIRFERGIPTLLTNMSGHYRPAPRKLNYVLRLFEVAGVPTDRLNLLVQIGDKNRFYDRGEINVFRQELRTELRAA